MERISVEDIERAPAHTRAYLRLSLRLTVIYVRETTQRSSKKLIAQTKRRFSVHFKTLVPILIVCAGKKTSSRRSVIA